MPRLVLVPSPFVGAVSWRATAERLPDAVAADYGPLSGPDWYEGVAARVARQAGAGPWIAVLHSGAGGFAPALADVSDSLAGFIFADAVLPYPGRSCLENAPEALRDQLRRLETGGRLAPWNRWFEDDPLPRLIPEPVARAAFEADLPAVPWAFLEAVSAPADRWRALPTAYLQLSRNYEDTAAKAEALGWRLRRARLHHLAMASHPAEMAGLIAELAATL